MQLLTLCIYLYGSLCFTNNTFSSLPMYVCGHTVCVSSIYYRNSSCSKCTTTNRIHLDGAFVQCTFLGPITYDDSWWDDVLCGWTFHHL